MLAQHWDVCQPSAEHVIISEHTDAPPTHTEAEETLFQRCRPVHKKIKN